MKQLAIVLCIVAALAANPAEGRDNDWPRLDDGRNIAQCSEAFQVAKAAFQSNSFYLFAPPAVPADSTSVLVLGPDSLDLSGGDSLKADQATFDKLPIGGESGSRSIYWQKKPSLKVRLVVQEAPHGWRGDMYSLFAIGEGVTPGEFLEEVRKDHQSAKFVPLIGGTWRPPLIFQEKQSGSHWIIDVGQPFYFLGDWRVYVAGSDGTTMRCTVHFRPNVKKAVSLLPAPVRRLATLLDRTMGPGINEGTLQPTARLRIDVEHTWANAALRPWALGKPYNTRAEVESGLKEWSRNGPTYLKVYQDIQHQYPLAEQSLAEYYQRNFRRSADEAKSLSAYVLDIALRSHYAFHSEERDGDSRNDKAEPNPWR